MYKFLNTLLMIFCVQVIFAQSGNHISSGSEFVSSGVISLTTSSSWTTNRSATPGYFAAIGTASYTDPSDASNVNGYVKHYADAANQEFNFPVGSGTDYRFIGISGTRTGSSVIASAWIQGNPSDNLDPTAPNAGAHSITSLGAGIQSVSNIGQWDWQDLSNNSGGLTVKVSIPSLASFGTASNLRLVGWNGTQWVNLSGNTGASGNTENSTLSGTMINGITALGIGLADLDIDGDGTLNLTDLDDDNDGILDTVENASACGTTVSSKGTNTDCDGDGVPNSLDLDSDNDGINDVIEAGGKDDDNNGQADGQNGTTPSTNGIPSSAGQGLTPPNTDGTGESNPYDLDSDGDGITDLQEAGINPGLDTDNDGVIDGNDDIDKDGILTPVDGSPNSIGDSLQTDLTPTIEIDGLEFTTQGQKRDFIVNIFENNNVNNVSGKPIAFRLSKQMSAFNITYSTASGTSDVDNGTANSNGDWLFSENSNFITVTAKTGIVIPAGGGKQIGFTVTRKTGIPSNTKQTITVIVIFGSGGEVKTDNNIAVTRIIAN